MQPTEAMHAPAQHEIPAEASRKRILLLVPSLSGGGAERVFSTLLRHLDRRRFEIHLAVLQTEGTFMEDIPADVTIHDLQVSRVRYALPRIVKLAWKLRPRTILSTLGHLNLALLFGKPLLPRDTRLLIRETVIASTVLREEMRYPWLWKSLYRLLYPRADKIVCLSESMVRDLVEHFGAPRQNLVCIYNPVDIARVRKLADAGENPYSGPGPHLVTAGRLRRQKGFDLLLAAMPSILAHFANAQLTILGEGPLQTELASQAQKLGVSEAVRFLGFQKNPWRYFKHASLFVLPSRYEGMSNVLLEAMALGLPIVATDCPGAVREMQSYAKEMILAPMENPAALANAIISVCTKQKPDQQRLEESQSSLDVFDVQRITGQYSALF